MGDNLVPNGLSKGCEPGRGERAVELTVDCGIPDTTKFVDRGVRIQGATPVEALYERKRVKQCRAMPAGMVMSEIGEGA
jgi:phage terminase large subunit-like protein